MLHPVPIFLLCACMMTGCAAPHPMTSSPTPCDTAYTFAHGNYIIDLASGSEVVLDPLAHDFPLFCSPEEAQNALASSIANGELPKGDWRIYRLDGDFEDLAARSGRGYMLKRMTSLTDWVSIKK